MRIAAVLALLALAGCGGDEPRRATPSADGLACTEIGCNDIAQVELAETPSGRVVVRMCVEDRCQRSVSHTQLPAALGIPLPESTGDSVRVSVTVRRNGRTLARATGRIPVTTTRPNGPDCPPVCRIADARLDVATGTLVPA